MEEERGRRSSPERVMRSLKKVIAWIACAAMVCTGMPAVTALAADESEGGSIPGTGNFESGASYSWQFVESSSDAIPENAKLVIKVETGSDAFNDGFTVKLESPSNATQIEGETTYETSSNAFKVSEDMPWLVFTGLADGTLFTITDADGNEYASGVIGEGSNEVTINYIVKEYVNVGDYVGYITKETPDDALKESASLIIIVESSADATYSVTVTFETDSNADRKVSETFDLEPGQSLIFVNMDGVAYTVVVEDVDGNFIAEYEGTTGGGDDVITIGNSSEEGNQPTVISFPITIEINDTVVESGNDGQYYHTQSYDGEDVIVTITPGDVPESWSNATYTYKFYESGSDAEESEENEFNLGALEEGTYVYVCIVTAYDEDGNVIGRTTAYITITITETQSGDDENPGGGDDENPGGGDGEDTDEDEDEGTDEDEDEDTDEDEDEDTDEDEDEDTDEDEDEDIDEDENTDDVKTGDNTVVRSSSSHGSSGSSSSSRSSSSSMTSEKSGKWILEGALFTYPDGTHPSNEYLNIDGEIWAFYTNGFAVNKSHTQYYTDEAIAAAGNIPTATGTWEVCGWWYEYDDGTYPANDWAQLSYNGQTYWYYFDVDGWMVDGWLNWEGNTYYLDPVYDGFRGHMVIGWQLIDGVWYYFESDGALFKNGVTPDGYTVDANGAWIE